MSPRIPYFLKFFSWIAIFSGAAFTYYYYNNNSERLTLATESAERCERVAAQIEILRHAPQKARLASRSADDLGSYVEKAAANAQLAHDHVLRIDPQPSKRLGKTDYLAQDTEVELLSINLRQLVNFLFNVTGSEGELGIATLRLQQPHANSENTSNELWLANVVLTQHVYAPTTAR